MLAEAACSSTEILFQLKQCTGDFRERKTLKFCQWPQEDLAVEASRVVGVGVGRPMGTWMKRLCTHRYPGSHTHPLQVWGPPSKQNEPLFWLCDLI